MNDRTIRCRHFIIAGKVQGVAYRATACAEARRLGLDGWVRNLSDGRVEALASGSVVQLDAFARWLERGPPAARVSTVQVSERDEAVERGFEIR